MINNKFNFKLFETSIYNSITYQHLISIRSIIGHSSRKQSRLINSFIIGWRNKIAIFDQYLIRLHLLNLSVILKWGGYRRLVFFLILKDLRFLNLINRNWLKYERSYARISVESSCLTSIFLVKNWISGLLSNWNKLYSMFLKSMNKKNNKLHLNKKYIKFIKKTKDIFYKKYHPSYPDFVILIGSNPIIIQEAFRIHLPILGIVDSNSTFKGFHFFIPGNDDSFDFQNFFVELIFFGFKEGSNFEIEIFLNFYLTFLFNYIYYNKYNL